MKPKQPHPGDTPAFRRILWLTKNWKLWDGYGPHQNNWLTIEQDLLQRMKEANLFEQNTTLLDVSFERLIGKARRMIGSRYPSKEKK